MTRFGPKGVLDVLDYRIDWTAALGLDTIATSIVTVTGATKDSDAKTDTAVTVWISGGTAGVLIKVVNVITTAQGRTLTRLDVIPYREPVSLELAKLQCRLELDETVEDELLGSYIIAARRHVESITGLILIRREVVEHHDALTGPLWLDAWPIDSVDEVLATDNTGAPLAIVDYRAVLAKRPGKLHPPRDADWPTVSDVEGVSVTMTAGYEEGDVPEPLVQAMLLLIHHWFVNRGAVVVGSISGPIGFAVNALCDPYRSMRTS